MELLRPHLKWKWNCANTSSTTVQCMTVHYMSAIEVSLAIKTKEKKIAQGAKLLFSFTSRTFILSMACRKITLNVGAIAARRPLSYSPAALCHRQYSEISKDEEVRTKTHTGQVMARVAEMLCKHCSIPPSIQIELSIVYFVAGIRSG